jgi:hypothetical protein
VLAGFAQIPLTITNATKFVRDVRPGRDLIPLFATVAVALLSNMAIGFLAGLAVHYGMEKWWKKPVQ